jgi:Carboxypeptidase regulatory-like domain
MIILASVARAQNAPQNVSLTQNAILKGQVVDELGDAIPNAEIKLIGRDLKERTARSNANGDFSIMNVPPGTYTLTSAFVGFQMNIRENVKVPGAQLKIVMAVASVSEAVETKAEEGISVEPDQNMSATVLGEDFIKDLPDNEEDLLDFLQTMAGPAAGGATGGQGGAEILIDGFNGGRMPPREAIQQIRINNSPFSAQYRNPGFGRIEIITKPGLGEWRGGGGFGYHNSALDARNAFALEKPDFSMQRYNFNLGGPIIRKKLSFFMYGDRNEFAGNNTANAFTLAGPFAENVPTSSVGYSLGMRADYLIDEKNTLNLSYNYRRRKNLNGEFVDRGGGGGSDYLLPERGTDSSDSEHTLRIGETWIINSSLINEARMEYDREHSGVVARKLGLTINVLDSFNGGGSSCCPNESRSDEIEFQNYLTFTDNKRHTIKAGVQFERENIRDLNGSNFNGTYTFSNLNEYRIAVENEGTELARAQQFTINMGDPYILYKLYNAGFFIQEDFRVRQSLTLSFGLREEFQSYLPDRNNWSPRLGIAWSPFNDRKTVIRGGWGLFYGRLNGGTYESTIRFNGDTQQSLIINNARYPDPFAGNPVIEQRNRREFKLDPNLKAPYTVNLNVSLERQLPRGMVGTFTYTHATGIHQFRLRNTNAPFPGTGGRPDPNDGNIYLIESTARSTFDGLVFGFQRRFSQRMFFSSNYTLSWTNSDADGPMSLPANNYNLRPEWGRAFTDRRHSFGTAFSLELPRGFRIQSYLNAYSGTPFNIRTGDDDNGDFEINDRPAGINRNSDLPANLYHLVPNRLICVPGTSPSARADGSSGVVCNPGGVPQIGLRDFLTQYYPDGVTAVGPGSFNANLSVSKTFGFGRRDGQTAGMGPGRDDRVFGDGRRGGDGRGDGRGGRRRSGDSGGGRGGGMVGGDESSRVNVTLSVRVSNLFNRVNFGRYGNTLGSTYFGVSSDANTARRFDFNVRFNF